MRSRPDRLMVAVVALAMNVDIASADPLEIELPPLADAILNGDTTGLDPALLGVLQGDFSFALGLSLGIAFAAENVALTETFTQAIAISRGAGSSDVQAVAEAFAGADLTRALTGVSASALQPPTPVSAD